MKTNLTLKSFTELSVETLPFAPFTPSLANATSDQFLPTGRNNGRSERVWFDGNHKAPPRRTLPVAWSSAGTPERPPTERPDAAVKGGLRFRLVLTGLCLLGAAGCVSYPISKPFRERAQATQGVSFLTISQNANAYQGRTVIWGGKILKTVNETNGGSIYVLQSPLDSQERPNSTKFSQGRFIARSSGFLDPEVYRTGAKITIAGEVSGTETQTVDKAAYVYPVVALREVYFWRPEAAAQLAPDPWGWGWYGPYWPYGDGFYGYYSYPGYYPGYHRDWDRRFDHRPRRVEEGEHERR